MKKDIHPNYKKTTIKCVCGNEIETGSTEDNITVEICNACHPFYTGNQKILDSEGRVERFRKRYEKNSCNKAFARLITGHKFIIKLWGVENAC